MKRVFFAGKFNKKIVDGRLSLIDDYRVPLAGSEEKFLYYNDGNDINDYYYYIGTFYNEKASNGQLTNSDCEQVVKAEFELINSCDLFCAYLDSKTDLSLGTVVELIYAATNKKDVLIFYNEKETSYEIQSEYWYPIIATQQLLDSENKLDLIRISDVKEIYEYFDKSNSMMSRSN